MLAPFSGRVPLPFSSGVTRIETTTPDRDHLAQPVTSRPSDVRSRPQPPARLSLRRTLLCFFTFLACAEVPPPETPKAEVDPAVLKRLDEAASAHREMQEALAATPSSDREMCEFQVGDCRLFVQEQQDRLLAGEESSRCQVLPDAAAKIQCMANLLVGRGEHEALTDYYAFHDACTQQILTCTDGLAARALASAAESRFRTRREELEATERGLQARARVEGTKAGTAYLRATLPPAASSACDLSDQIDSCMTPVRAMQREFEDALRQEQYDEARATALYEERAQAEQACRAPEIACLQEALADYGLLPEARPVTRRNLQLLVRREGLKGRVDARAASGCVDRLTSEHQERIVGAYVTYVREPVLYYRRELDRAFRGLHEAQVACLTARARTQSNDRSAKR